MELAHKRCIPCEGNVPPLGENEARDMLAQVPGWELGSEHSAIERTFMFKDFDTTMSFVNEVAKVAEEEGHHPDMSVSYGKVRVELTTHAIGGLSENDFILAAKINNIQNGPLA